MAHLYISSEDVQNTPTTTTARRGRVGPPKQNRSGDAVVAPFGEAIPRQTPVGNCPPRNDSHNTSNLLPAMNRSCTFVQKLISEAELGLKAGLYPNGETRCRGEDGPMSFSPIAIGVKVLAANG